MEFAPTFLEFANVSLLVASEEQLSGPLGKQSKEDEPWLWEDDMELQKVWIGAKGGECLVAIR